MHSAAPSRTVTGSSRADLAIAALIAAAMLALSWRLTVYFGATVIDVRIERIDPGGAVTPVPTPDAFRYLGAGYWKIHEVERHVRPLIAAHMRQSDLAAHAPPGTRFVWTVRSSRNHARLDRELRIVWERPDDR